jgi:penicillin-binding protein 1A
LLGSEQPRTDGAAACNWQETTTPRGTLESHAKRMSRQTRQRRRRHKGGRVTGLVFAVLGVVAVLCTGGVLAAVGYVVSVTQKTKPLSALKPAIEGGTSEVIAADGTSLGFVRSDESRSPVGWGQIPGSLRNATVSIEDQRFYKNDGIDVTGIFRAAVKDATHGKVLQGGSTITMQLMRNLYLGTDEKLFPQKIREAKYAIEYSRTHTKHEILTAYLNSIPYGTVGGQTAIGVQAASHMFFDKSVWQLDLEQSALLAGLPQAPSQYNPFNNPKEAATRRNEVLAKMAQLHYISPAQAASAEAAALELKHGNYYTVKREHFFFEYVREQLEQRYGKKVVEQGGLKVYTTLDLHKQDLARQAIKEVLNEPTDPAAAAVTIDPHNGHIEAMAESESYGQSQYNLATVGHRQPGSTFKAIDLAVALSRGIDPNSTYYVSHTIPAGTLPGWLVPVKTFENTSLNKSFSIVQALLASDNTVYAQLAADLGQQSITEMAYKLGVQKSAGLKSYPAEALGGLTLGVTPLEMADVYATLANGGIHNAPIAITKVAFPDGRVDTSWDDPPPPTRAERSGRR